MNRKGFTMVELLVVISLIAIMSILIAINMTGILSEQNSSSFNSVQSKIESAACTYIDMQENHALRDQYKNNSSGGTVNLSTLIQKGLIDGEIKDPRNGKTLEEEQSTLNVTIKWVNKQKTCTLNV